MRIALAQLVAGADPAANLDLVAEAARDAADQRADLLSVPRPPCGASASPWPRSPNRPTVPGRRGSPTSPPSHGLVIAAGMFTPADDGRVRNTLRVVGPGVDAGYDKIHLYDAFGFAESDTVAPGTDCW